MAAVTRRPRVSVRAARPGEGEALAELWRDLWDAHEHWGGYPGSHDDAVYRQLAARLDDDARARAGQPALGRHLHLVAALDGGIAGQVEGWVERLGVDPSTPYTCEVRSLIVAAWARGAGLGRSLLDALAEAAWSLARGASLVLGAEVLEANPAHAFYERLGFVPVAWSLRATADLAAGRASRAHAESFTSRVAEPRDALALSALDAALASRRRALGDARYDRPRSVDAAAVSAIASHLRGARAGHPLAPGVALELVAEGRDDRVRASASFALSSLDPPFVAGRRAVLGRFAFDPALDAAELCTPLIAYGRRLAAEGGARTIELTEISAPGTLLHASVVAGGGSPWSRIVTRTVPRR